jgi:hypothetical protein
MRMNEQIIGFRGKLEEAQGWLADAVSDLSEYNDITEEHYPEVKDALQLCAEARQRMVNAATKVAHLLKAAEEMEKEAESWAL